MRLEQGLVWGRWEKIQSSLLEDTEVLDNTRTWVW